IVLTRHEGDCPQHGTAHRERNGENAAKAKAADSLDLRRPRPALGVGREEWFDARPSEPMIGELLRDRLLRWIRMRDLETVHSTVELDDVDNAPAVTARQRAPGNGGSRRRLVERFGQIATHRGHEATARAVLE